MDAEVLQEILHRYTSLRRTADRAIVYETAREVFDVVIPITAPVMEGAYGLLRRYARLSARDAVHAAVVAARTMLEGLGVDPEPGTRMLFRQAEVQFERVGSAA